MSKYGAVKAKLQAIIREGVPFELLSGIGLEIKAEYMNTIKHWFSQIQFCLTIMPNLPVNASFLDKILYSVNDILHKL
jgi:hypothetical protein